MDIIASRINHPTGIFGVQVKQTCLSFFSYFFPFQCQCAPAKSVVRNWTRHHRSLYEVVHLKRLQGDTLNNNKYNEKSIINLLFKVVDGNCVNFLSLDWIIILKWKWISVCTKFRKWFFSNLFYNRL